MSITLAVPTLKRYDLLLRMLASAASGTVRPDRYVIVDNGAGLRRYLYDADLTLGNIGKVEVHEQDQNLGVAASWNFILELTEREGRVIITNDDVLFRPSTIEALVWAADEDPKRQLISTRNQHVWVCFLQRYELVKKIGWYDEGFQAYFEDLDYKRRMELAGIPIYWQEHALVEHEGNASTTGEERRALSDASKAYYRAKWGGLEGEERFTVPFDGKPPEGWRERR